MAEFLGKRAGFWAGWRSWAKPLVGEGSFRMFDGLEWVRGLATRRQTPHPNPDSATLWLPSPARGEGTTTAAALMAAGATESPPPFAGSRSSRSAACSPAPG